MDFQPATPHASAPSAPPRDPFADAALDRAASTDTVDPLNSAAGGIANAGHRASARWILGAALTMGLIGERLDVRWFDGNAGLALWLTAATMLTPLTLARMRGTVSRLAHMLFAIAATFAVLLAWRTSELLQLGNIVVVLSTIALAVAVELHTPANALLRVRDVLSHVVVTAREAVVGSLRFLFLDAVDAFSISSVRFYVTGLVARGLLLGLAVTSVFAVLLSAGDPVFAKWIAVPFGWNPEPLVQRLVIAGVWTWPALGVLRMATRGAPALPGMALFGLAGPGDTTRDAVPRVQLNRLDVLTVLSSLVGLFSLFVLAQVRVLFGGTAYVSVVTGLTLAEYARSGFFTLVAAAGLSVAALLSLNALLKDGSLSEWTTARRLSYTLLGGVGVVLASAATRMALYVQSFGASVERYYTFGIMLWVAFVLVWCGRTVLRNRPRFFAIGALAAGWCTLLLGNVLNVEAMVVRSNVARWQQGKAFDFVYHGNLGVDAMPALIEGISAMPLSAFPSPSTPNNACATISRLRAWSETQTGEVGLGHFNVANWRARRAAAAHQRDLEARACVSVVPTTTTTTAAAPTAATPAASPPRATVP